MNPPKGSKPFNLEAALRGEPTIHRDGTPGPTKFHLIPDEFEDNYPLITKDGGGAAINYTKRGTFYRVQGYEKDLFMAPKKVKHQAWVNLYANGSMGESWPTELGARLARCAERRLIETRLIEWESEDD